MRLGITFISLEHQAVLSKKKRDCESWKGLSLRVDAFTGSPMTSPATKHTVQPRSPHLIWHCG